MTVLNQLQASHLLGLAAIMSVRQSEREPLYSGQFEIPLRATSNADQRKPGNLRELKKQKVILLAAEFDPQAFNSGRDEPDCA